MEKPPEIERFKILKKLGEGGFGKVYKAKNRIGRLLALKKINEITEEYNPLKEAKIQAELKHPGIVELYDYDPETQQIEMEYMSKGSLADKLKNKKPLPYSEAIKITTEILEALTYAHKKGYIHRDIKPSNILFNAQGNAKISDFGLAKLIEQEINILPEQIKKSKDINSLLYLSAQTTKSKIKGTLPYMAPEQLQGKPTPQSDLYSIGIILYEMLTGTLPEGTFPKLPSEINKKIPKGIDEICKKALCTVQERYANAKQMTQDIKNTKQTDNYKKPDLERITKKLGSAIENLSKATKWALPRLAIGSGIIAGLGGLGIGGYYIIKEGYELIQNIPKEYAYSAVIGGGLGLFALPGWEELTESNKIKKYAYIKGALGGVIGALLIHAGTNLAMVITIPPESLSYCLNSACSLITPIISGLIGGVAAGPLLPLLIEDL